MGRGDFQNPSKKFSIKNPSIDNMTSFVIKNPIEGFYFLYFLSSMACHKVIGF